MDHSVWLYCLVFVFGYITCKTFYFLSSARKSMQLIHVTQLIALFITVKALENFQYSRQYRLNVLKESKASEQNLQAFQRQFTDELTLYKKRAIQKIVDAHGGFFDHLVKFHDWDSAMKFLETNRDDLIKFITED